MEVQGRAFADDEDWLARLRDVISRPGGGSELARLQAAARGTPRAPRLADAVLRLVEGALREGGEAGALAALLRPSRDPAGEPSPDPAGEPSPDAAGEPARDPAGEPSPDAAGEPARDPAGEPADEAAGASSREGAGASSREGAGASSREGAGDPWRVPVLREAPDAVRRLTVLLQRPLPAEARAWLAGELLAIERDEPNALAVLRASLEEPELEARALIAAARWLPEWPGAWLARAAPDGALLLALWRETPVLRRRAFVDAVAATSEPHLAALIDGARELGRRSREQATPLLLMLAPHLPDPTSGEIVLEAMVGTLRANRRDPRQAELAERVLHKHELWPKK